METNSIAIVQKTKDINEGDVVMFRIDEDTSLDCVICANFLGCFFRKREIFIIDSGMPVEYFEPHERGNLYLALKKMLSMVEKIYGVTLDERDFLCS